MFFLNFIYTCHVFSYKRISIILKETSLVLVCRSFAVVAFKYVITIVEFSNRLIQNLS